ncbi:unnamed protein product [Rotaria sp. Silwood1]|nr:unnamed protein product [Rotaria sp. Silwood1]
MKLIIDHKNHPLWVTPDGHIFFLESFPSAYKQAHVFIITIADPISQPEYIQEYKLSACSLYATLYEKINHDNEDLKKVSFEILPNKIKRLRKRCQQFEYPLLDEYNFHCNRIFTSLNSELRSSLRNMFANRYAWSGLIVLPCGVNHIAEIKCDEAWYRTTLEFLKKYFSIKNDQFRRLLLLAFDGINLTALRELKFLQEVKHPHVTELLETFEEYVSNSPRICLVFEFMNTNLENIINNNLHNNWILHRDLKSNNLLIDKGDVLKIADFGLANFFGSSSRLMSHDVITR